MCNKNALTFIKIEMKRISGITVLLLRVYFHLNFIKKYQYVLLHIAFLKVILLPHFETISVFAFQVEIRDLYYIHTG